MTASTLEEKLEAQVREFTVELAATIRTIVLADLKKAMGFPEDDADSASRRESSSGSPETAKRATSTVATARRASRRRRPGRPRKPRRLNATARGDMADQVAGHVAKFPGLGAKKIREALALNGHEWRVAVQLAVHEGKIVREGERWEAVYFPRADLDRSAVPIKEPRAPAQARPLAKAAKGVRKGTVRKSASAGLSPRAKRRQIATRITQYVREQPGMSTRAIRESLRLSFLDMSRGMSMALEEGMVRIDDGSWHANAQPASRVPRVVRIRVERECMSELIVDYIATHPGQRSGQICTALSLGHRCWESCRPPLLAAGRIIREGEWAKSVYYAPNEAKRAS